MGIGADSPIQQDLFDINAEQLGVSAVTVSKWCSNITQPTLPNLNRIAEILDVDPRDLLNGRD